MSQHGSVRLERHPKTGKPLFWLGRWREDVVLPDGSIKRKQRSQKLVDYSYRYRRKKDVRPLLDKILRPINENRVSPESTLPITTYVERFFLPRAEADLKPSTANGYNWIWKMYVRDQVEDYVLRDFRCVDATAVLAQIHRKHGIGRGTLKHCKSLLSSVFSYARQQGVLDGVNPVIGAAYPRAAAKSKPTTAYSAEEIAGMLDVLEGAPRVAVALMFFCGLRPGEARGLRWSDYDGKCVRIRRSVWGKHETAPKTDESEGVVPVPAVLAEILDAFRPTSLHQRADDYVLAGPTGKPLDLHNVSNRTVKPALAKARKDGKISFDWRGWYPCRRGLGTLATSLQSPLAAKTLLRHRNIAVTEAHYIKDVPEDAQRAAEKIDALFQAAKGPVQ